MNLKRKINRNKLKKSQGNNKIRGVWREYQISKYGIRRWCRMFNASTNIKDKGNRITPKTAYYRTDNR